MVNRTLIFALVIVCIVSINASIITVQEKAKEEDCVCMIGSHCFGEINSE